MAVFSWSRASTATAVKRTPTTENLQLQSPFCRVPRFSKTPTPRHLSLRIPLKHLLHRPPQHRSPDARTSALSIATPFNPKRRQGQRLLSLLISRSVPTSL